MSNLVPDKMFDRRWALIVLEHTMARLEEQERQGGKGVQFERLSAFLNGDPGPQRYAEAGAELGLSRDAVA